MKTHYARGFCSGPYCSRDAAVKPDDSEHVIISIIT